MAFFAAPHALPHPRVMLGCTTLSRQFWRPPAPTMWAHVACISWCVSFAAVKVRMSANRFLWQTKGDVPGLTACLQTGWDCARSNQDTVWAPSDHHPPEDRRRRSQEGRLWLISRPDRLQLPLVAHKIYFAPHLCWTAAAILRKRHARPTNGCSWTSVCQQRNCYASPLSNSPAASCAGQSPVTRMLPRAIKRR